MAAYVVNIVLFVTIISRIYEDEWCRLSGVFFLIRFICFNIFALLKESNTADLARKRSQRDRLLSNGHIPFF